MFHINKSISSSSLTHFYRGRIIWRVSFSPSPHFFFFLLSSIWISSDLFPLFISSFVLSPIYASRTRFMKRVPHLFLCSKCKYSGMWGRFRITQTDLGLKNDRWRHNKWLEWRPSFSSPRSLLNCTTLFDEFHGFLDPFPLFSSSLPIWLRFLVKEVIRMDIQKLLKYGSVSTLLSFDIVHSSIMQVVAHFF